jgi:membrane protein YdbS with pleckstrin-like domain
VRRELRRGARLRTRRAADQLSHDRLETEAGAFATALELELIGAEDLARRYAEPGMELRAGEHELYEGRPSWRALMSFYAGGLSVAALAIVILGLLAGSWALAISVAGAIAGLTLVIGYLRRVSTKYLITNQRLRISRGIVRRNVQETRLERVQNVNYQQGVLDRLFGVGTVDFDTAGTDDSEFRFEWVNGPEQVVRAVDRAVEEARDAAASPGTDPGLS